MGLGMIEAMRVFDAERHEGIKMRVGIHTGEWFFALDLVHFDIILLLIELQVQAFILINLRSILSSHMQNKY